MNHGAFSPIASLRVFCEAMRNAAWPWYGRFVPAGRLRTRGFRIVCEKRKRCDRMKNPPGNRLALRSANLAAVGLLLLSAWASAGTSVFVLSVSAQRVQLLVNGASVRVLAPGERSPEGVRLVEITGDSALVEVDGRRWSMRIGSSTASSVVLQADARGHFVTEAYINGLAVRAVVDTGASTLALNLADAARLGVDLSRARRIVVGTAGGPRAAWLATVAQVRVGDIALANVEAAFSEANDLPIALLGMSFLNHVEMQRSGRTLTLTRRH
jgi:aspartyl protease family protein